MRHLAACAARCSPPAHPFALCRRLAALSPSSLSRYAQHHIYNSFPGSFAAVEGIFGKKRRCCSSTGFK